MEFTLQKTQKGIRKLLFLLQLQLIDSKLSKGQDDYQKFIVLGRSRVGSNLLTSFLDSHPNVLTFGELYSNKTPGIVGYRLGKHEIPAKLREKEPLTFLSKYIFRKYPQQLKAVGFKLFYYHAQREGWEVVWDYLKQHPEMKIIHLKRKNLLRVLTSWEFAMQSKEWLSKGKQASADKKKQIHIKPESCYWTFEHTEKWQSEAEEFFANHPVYELSYEDLIAERDTKIAEIQAFLGLSSHPPQTALRKQNPRPLSSMISNFDELKAEFAHTKWAWFFEE